MIEEDKKKKKEEEESNKGKQLAAIKKVSTRGKSSLLQQAEKMKAEARQAEGVRAIVRITFAL